MATFKLPGGERVIATRVEDEIEFVTYNNNREVISTVRKNRADAAPILAALTVADGLRFARTYGMAGKAINGETVHARP